MPYLAFNWKLDINIYIYISIKQEKKVGPHDTWGSAWLIISGGRLDMKLDSCTANQYRYN